MEQQQHFECDTPDCIHWKDGECTKGTPVTIQEHHCTDFEEAIVLPESTVTIEVRGGVVQNVYPGCFTPEGEQKRCEGCWVVRMGARWVRFERNEQYQLHRDKR